MIEPAPESSLRVRKRVSVRNVALRVDASAAIGSGHLTRCIALALALRKMGAHSTFVCAELPDTLERALVDGGFDVARLPVVGMGSAASTPFRIDELADSAATLRTMEGAGRVYDCVVADHYGIGSVWHGRVRALAPLVVAVDDLADRPLDADIIVNPNPGRDDRYAGLVPGHCRLLLGPRFALLRPEFAECRARMPPRLASDTVRVLLFAGGGDPDDATGTVLDAWELFSGRSGVLLDVVIGAQNHRASEIRARCARMGDVVLHVQTDQMASLLARSDILIGAAGGVSWERCCLGVASLMFSIAENQTENLRFLAARRTGIDLGAAKHIDPQELSQKIRRVLARPRLIRRMARRAENLVDGVGATRAALVLCASSLSLRDAQPDDALVVWPWRNHPSTRRFFRDNRALLLAEHLEWWQQSLTDRKRRLLVAYCGALNVGVLRFDICGDSAEVSIYLDPSLTGLGLGRAMLRAGQEWARGSGHLIVRLKAEISQENHASKSAFAAVGFSQRGSSWCWEVDR